MSASSITTTRIPPAIARFGIGTLVLQRDAHGHVTHPVSRSLVNRRRNEYRIYRGWITQ